MLWSLLKKGGWPDHWWTNWFFIDYLIVIFVIGVISTVWFSIGGIVDLRRMFKRLAARKTNVLDDGRVVGRVSAEDVSMVEKVEGTRIDEAHQTEKVIDESPKKQDD